jgi:hypothetical protein
MANLWQFLEALQNPEDLWISRAHGEFYLRQGAALPPTKPNPQPTWFNNPDCLEPIDQEDDNAPHTSRAPAQD